jgi:hypothetical protein
MHLSPNRLDAPCHAGGYNVRMDTIVTSLYDRIDELEELRPDAEDKAGIDEEIVSLREQIETLVERHYVEPVYR